jgi:hypothetical protein
MHAALKRSESVITVISEEAGRQAGRQAGGGMLA